jgi:hypothetical protein
MLRFFAILLVAAFCVSALPIDAAHAGWKESYTDNYSKTQKTKSSRIANMDFIYKWSGEPKRRSPYKESNDKFTGYSANFGPCNAKGPEEVTGEPSGYTLKGVIQDMGNAIVNPREEAKLRKGSVSAPSKRKRQVK